MPLQNRVSPFGHLFAASARGLMMGNRGGRLHDAQSKLASRRWVSKQWICCKLEFNDRHRKVWGEGYSELFFLDEVTAFAAGHRPCFECRRKDAENFATLFPSADPNPAHSRVSGNPGTKSQRQVFAALGPRFRGDERNGGRRATAAVMDAILHAERLAGKDKRMHRRSIDELPDGAMIALGTDAFAVRDQRLLRWTPTGYAEAQPRRRAIAADVLTPPSVLAVLSRGYAPLWHPSAT